MHWYLAVLRKYAAFEGRAPRAEYWYFLLISTFLYVSLTVLDVVAGSFSAQSGFGLVAATYALATLVPGFAVTVRRLHDTDRSGWAALAALIPLVGPLALLAFMAQRGQQAANRFGPDPLEPPRASAAPDVAISTR